MDPAQNNIDPRTEYALRIEARRLSRANCESMHRRIGNARFVLFIAAAVTAWFAFTSPESVSPWWLLLPFFGFIALVVWHSRVLGKLRRFQNAVRFYENGLARLDERWEDIGITGDHHDDPSHPYARDLDLFGRGSLFQLICSARTSGGESKLASWLKHPASPEEIRSRQKAVTELRANLDLREDLAVIGTDIGSGIHSSSLVDWSEGETGKESLKIPIIAGILAAATIASLIFWFVEGEYRWFLIMAAIELVFIYRRRRTVRSIVSSAEKACNDLKLLSLVLARMEKERFKTDVLVKLSKALECDGLPPSKSIARLNRLIVLLDSRKNQLFAPIAFILLWEMQLAHLLENWRRRNGRAIAGWLDAAAELEALSSLAGYAYEHPRDPFPELSDETPWFEGRGLGHPLIPESKCVPNDVRLTGEMRLFIVSGSNMSGKSTLLRTVGANAVLALAGAPVRAHSLRIAPMAIGASIRVADSLQEGTSRFYAEIKRLQKLMSLAEGPLPLLFLLDELLHGTNSNDRRIGAEAVVKGMVRRGAVGLLTTHDLALSHIADVLSPEAANVHFEDHLENGRMIFDYRLQPGIVRKSNALELMRSIGLEV
ncbi:MAG TPA: DNA mismatch repair protein MutS [Acidobacteriota bacterium]|nr:DNA mismatch repair protein MutS [Acidobacteriota bacterium]